MKQPKTSLILFLSVLAIVLGVLLPRMVSWIVDAIGLNQVDYSQISAVHLEFEDSGLSLQEKMPLLTGYVDAVEISPSMAALQTEEVQELVSQAVARYVQAGLFSSALDGATAELRPCLYYASFDPAEEVRSNIFWEAIIMPKKGGPYLRLLLDDQTGAVCTIDFESPDAIFPESVLEQHLQSLCTLYLEGLGDDFADYDPLDLVQSAQIPADSRNYAGAELSWSDPAYGNIRISIVLYTAGIYVYIY